jgi:hypothetical protein
LQVRKSNRCVNNVEGMAHMRSAPNTSFGAKQHADTENSSDANLNALVYWQSHQDMRLDILGLAPQHAWL